MHQVSDDAVVDQLPDQREYLNLGTHLFSDGLWMADPRFEQVVYAFRTPGYPFLVACCGGNLKVIRIVQCVLDDSTVLAIFLLARHWLGPMGGLIAAAIVAVNPFLIFFCGLILSEALFTAMMCWGMALLVLCDGPWPEGGKLLGWLGGGVTLALAILVRPGAILLPVVLGCGGAMANQVIAKRNVQRWPMPVAAVMLLITGLVLFPWAARNRWVLGSWIWTSTNDGITRYDGFNPDATGASDQKFVQSMPWTGDMSEVARSRYFAEMADDWITNHPTEAVRLAGLKIARTWSPMPLSQQYGGRWLYKTVGICYGVALDLLVLIGLRRNGLSGRSKAFLLLPAIYFTVGAGLSVGSLRYLVPAEGPMAIVGAAAFGAWNRD
jgi:4-amino-4-deoxy-L-arabinose transferase-like glycosyltransferase